MNSDEFLKQENTTKTDSNIFKLNKPDKNDPLHHKEGQSKINHKQKGAGFAIMYFLSRVLLIVQLTAE